MLQHSQLPRHPLGPKAHLLLSTLSSPLGPIPPQCHENKMPPLDCHPLSLSWALALTTHCPQNICLLFCKGGRVRTQVLLRPVAPGMCLRCWGKVYSCKPGLIFLPWTLAILPNNGVMDDSLETPQRSEKRFTRDQHHAIVG